MSHVLVDASLHERSEVNRLRKRLQLAEAEIYVIRLWAWGIRTDCRDGRVEMDPLQLASITMWRGEPGLLFDALLECGFLVPIPEEPGFHYMRGWSRNQRFFERKEKRNRYMSGYMREYRAHGPKRGRPAKDDDAPTTDDTALTANAAPNETTSKPRPYRTVPSRTVHSECGGGGGESVNVNVNVYGTLTLDQLQTAVCNEFQLPGLPPRYVPRLQAAADAGRLTRNAVDYAWRDTVAVKEAEGKKPNAGLFCTKLLAALDAPAALAPPKKVNGRKHNGTFQDQAIEESLEFARRARAQEGR